MEVSINSLSVVYLVKLLKRERADRCSPELKGREKKKKRKSLVVFLFPAARDWRKGDALSWGRHQALCVGSLLFVQVQELGGMHRAGC